MNNSQQAERATCCNYNATTAQRERKEVSRVRKKLWKLDIHFHCAVIGTCFTLAELQRLARKLNVEKSHGATDYKLHRFFVGSVRKPGIYSRQLQKLLDKKFARTVKQLIPDSALPCDSCDGYPPQNSMTKLPPISRGPKPTKTMRMLKC